MRGKEIFRGKVNEKEHLSEDVGEVERGDRDKCMFAWPDRREKEGETRIERDIPESKGGGVDARNCPCGKPIESRTHTAAECELYKTKVCKIVSAIFHPLKRHTSSYVDKSHTESRHNEEGLEGGYPATRGR